MKLHRKNLPLLHRSFDTRSVILDDLTHRIAATGFIN
jgi:hypothetical protein